MKGPLALFDITWLAVPLLVFIPLERLLAARPSQPLFRRGWFTDFVYIFLNRPLIQLGLAAVIMAVTVLTHELVPSGVRAALAGQPLWVQLIEIFVLADAGFYVAHRTFHTVPGLWRFHAIHHSIEDLDWLAAARVHPIDQIVTKAVSLLPAFILGFSDVALGTFAVIYFWHSLLLHSNIDVGFGPLNALIASPRFHAWHHSNDRTARDKNFAAQLPFLDRLFGTYYVPADRAPERFGIDAPVPGTYLRNLAYPLLPRARRGKALAVAASTTAR